MQRRWSGVVACVHGEAIGGAELGCCGHFERGLEEVHCGREVASVEGGFMEEARSAHAFWMIGVELQDLEIHVCVCDDDVEGLVEGEEIRRHAFEVVFGATEQEHFVRLFLWGC